MLSPTVLKNTLILYNFAKCKVHTKIEKKKCNDQLSINFLSFKNLLAKFEAVCVTGSFPEKKHRGERRCVKFNNRVTDDPIGSAIV